MVAAVYARELLTNGSLAFSFRVRGHIHMSAVRAHDLLVLIVAAAACFGSGVSGISSSRQYAQRADELNVWLRSQTDHLSSPLIEVAATDTMGLGVVVGSAGAHRIRAGTRLLELPVNATLCRDRLSQQGSAGYGSILAQADEEQMVILSLLTEYSLGDLSMFAPWIRAMPRPSEIQTPFQWSIAERKLIEPRALAQMVSSIEGSVRQGYDNAKRHFAALQTFVKKRTESPLSDAFTFERYCWARSLVDTRAWNLQGKKYLVPVADFFNHEEDDHDKAYTFAKHVHSRSQKFMDYHMISNVKGVKVLRVLSDRDGGGAGTPLHESYGDNTNDIYFPYHGFIPVINRRDCQALRLGRGLVQRDRAGADAELLRMVSNDRGLQAQGQYDIWSVPVCVHAGEYPPLLEVVSWLVALGLTDDAPLRPMLKDCILTRWNQRGQGRAAQAGYQREDQLRRAMRSCLLETPQARTANDAQVREKILQTVTPVSVLRFVNRSHRIQHSILAANAREEFSTLKLDTEVAALQFAAGSAEAGDGVPWASVDKHRLGVIMSLRKTRKEFLKGALQLVRESQKAALANLQKTLHVTDESSTYGDL
jgi:hypothetical protein